jgi:hypothetical protein
VGLCQEARGKEICKEKRQQCKGTNAETLKRQRPIDEGDQELEKRSVRKDST